MKQAFQTLATGSERQWSVKGDKVSPTTAPASRCVCESFSTIAQGRGKRCGGPG